MIRRVRYTIFAFPPCYLVAFMFFTLCFSQSFSSPLYWTGQSDNRWENPDNWSFTSRGPSAHIVPGKHDDVFFTRAGNENRNISVEFPAETEVRSLSIESGVSVSSAQSSPVKWIIHEYLLLDGKVEFSEQTIWKFASGSRQQQYKVNGFLPGSLYFEGSECISLSDIFTKEIYITR